MSDEEHFLARWSRRKLAVQDPRAATAGEDTASEAAPDNAASEGPAAGTPGHRDRPAPQPTGQTPAEPAFDAASLPPLDSISAASDVKAFLQPGVPPELTRAALRRAWVTDPTIRDFVGLQEYDWDYNDPAGLLGFGELPAGTDVRKMVSDLFGETPPEAGEKDAAPPATEQDKAATVADASAPPSHAAESLADAASETGSDAAPSDALSEDQQADRIVHRTSNIASQYNEPEDSAKQIKVRRGHGRALPKV